MNVPLIDIDREAARVKVQEFTAKKRKQLTEMDRALLKGYRALSEGLTLIDVNNAVKRGGVFEETGLPKIALARPDAEVCVFNFQSTYRRDEKEWYGQFKAAREISSAARDPLMGKFWADWKSSPDEWRAQNHWHELLRQRGYVIELALEVIPAPPDEVARRRTLNRADYTTLVPETPLQFRPDNPDDYLVLWDVKEWTRYEYHSAPADPLLLERIAHPVYVVVAQWDLTELEQKLLESFRAR